MDEADPTDLLSRQHQLAKRERATHRRLLALRAELDTIANALDRAATARPRMMAGGSDLGLVGNLVTFPFRGRRR